MTGVLRDANDSLRIGLLHESSRVVSARIVGSIYMPLEENLRLVFFIWYLHFCRMNQLKYLLALSNQHLGSLSLTESFSEPLQGLSRTSNYLLSHRSTKRSKLLGEFQFLSGGLYFKITCCLNRYGRNAPKSWKVEIAECGKAISRAPCTIDYIHMCVLGVKV